MSSYRTHKQTLDTMLRMLEKGRLISREQAARLFGCRKETISIWINELRGAGHKIHFSRSLQKYVLLKKND